jgi:hypothetical protein
LAQVAQALAQTVPERLFSLAFDVLRPVDRTTNSDNDDLGTDDHGDDGNNNDDNDDEYASGNEDSTVVVGDAAGGRKRKLSAKMAAGTAKKPKRKPPTVDPAAPRRPATPFFVFSQIQRGDFARLHPTLSFAGWYFFFFFSFFFSCFFFSLFLSLSLPLFLCLSTWFFFARHAVATARSMDEHLGRGQTHVHGTNSYRLFHGGLTVCFSGHGGKRQGALRSRIRGVRHGLPGAGVYLQNQMIYERRIYLFLFFGIGRKGGARKKVDQAEAAALCLSLFFSGSFGVKLLTTKLIVTHDQCRRREWRIRQTTPTSARTRCWWLLGKPSTQN